MTKHEQDHSEARDVLLLRVFVGQAEVEHQAFTKNKIVIGRDPYADIYLEDAKISRVHATIDLERRRPIFHDHSTNGTVVNGKRVDQHEIQNGDEITISGFRIVVEIHSQSDSSFAEASRANGLGVDVEQTLRETDRK